MAKVNKETNYAVVKFLSDGTFSEIPILWLIQHNNIVRECWWPPRTANCATLIANCAHPNNTWKRYDVNFIKYCTSLESARKNASDANYETTDEERLGRGKRQHIPFNCCSSEEESDPCANKKKSRLYSNAISASPLYPDTLSLEYEYSNASISNASMSNASISNAFVSNASILNKSQSNAIPTISNASDYAMAATAQQEREMESHVASNIDLNTPIIIEEMLQQILRMLAVLNLSHKEVKQRLKKLEDVVKTSYPQRASDLHQDCEIMKEFLPFTTIDAVQEFDKVLLRTKEIAVQFRQFILKTGGNNPKDSIHRNLKKIFSNECAMQCSWKGLRNNFRISNLKVINILKGEITSQFSLTETEFDNIASEWFRFAKQRKERSDKAKEKEME